MKVKIAYQGIEGAYSEMAAENFAKQNFLHSKSVKAKKYDYKIVGFETFEEIFLNVEEGKISYGVIPVENSLGGSIHKNFELLAKYDLKVIAETYVHVNHQLLGLKNSTLKDIQEVRSHYQAIAQCKHNLEIFLPNAKSIEYFDTAASAKNIFEMNDKSKACLASKKAAKIYGLKVIKENFQDDNNNYTRFLVISKNYAKFKDVHGYDNFKTSIVFSGKSISGFLFKALACFSLRDINLLKIESRPIPKKPWEIMFYLDFEGKFNDTNVENALNNLREITNELNILGSYKAAKY